jgi:hypothetical protein
LDIRVFKHCGAIFVLANSVVDAYKDTSLRAALNSYPVNREAYLE